MLHVDLPRTLERHFRNVVQESYHGDLRAAIAALLRLHDEYGWKVQLLKDVKSVRSEVRRRGGIRQRIVEEAVRNYRKNPRLSRA